MGNDVARDVHCEIIMGNDIARGTYHDVTMHTDVEYDPHLLCIAMPNYEFSVILVKSFKMYIK